MERIWSDTAMDNTRHNLGIGGQTLPDTLRFEVHLHW
jgi:hypothetical protein